MTLLTLLLRKSWFEHYMLDPSKYRPGTRMPAAFPGGQTFYPKVLGGSADKQIAGIWVFLTDGAKAALPPGTKKQLVPLVPSTEAIVYRNFIQGAGPRAIGVGYPEQAHLAFDANDLRLALLWRGAFIDAGGNWTGRGVGFVPPAGDDVLHLPTGVAFALLDTLEQPWPMKSARDVPGYRFHGYRVTKDQRPTFLYTIHGVEIEDFPNAVATKTSPAIRRTFTLKAEKAPANLYFRAATGSKIVALADGWYQINEYKLRIEAGGAANPPERRPIRAARAGALQGRHREDYPGIPVVSFFHRRERRERRDKRGESMSASAAESRPAIEFQCPCPERRYQATCP